MAKAGVPKELRLFRNFLRIVWKHLGLPAPTPVQLDIADYLQFGPRRKIIEAFRGVGKSWITSAFVCWQLLLDPQKKFLVVSASKPRADDFSTFTLRLISEIPLLQHLHPDPKTQRFSKTAFDVGPARADHSPSVKSVGIFGQLTGTRADYIIADDVEVPNTALTATMRTRLSEAVKEFESIIKPGGTITFLGTPQTEESLYNKLIERGYAIRIWPARYPSPEAIDYYGAYLATFITERLAKGEAKPGDPVDPDRFSHEDLLEREASYGRSGFALQFMLDTRQSDLGRYPLRCRDLIVHPVDPEVGPVKLIWGPSDDAAFNDLVCLGFSGDGFYGPMAVARDEHGNISLREWEGKIMAIDPSGRGKDELAYCVAFYLAGYIHVPDFGGFRGVGYEEDVLVRLAQVAKRWGVHKIVVEPNYGGGMFNQLLKPVLERIYPCSIEDAKWSRVQKEVRIIDTLEPVMNQHRLVVSPEALRKDYESIQNLPVEEGLRYSLVYQITRVTRDRGALAHDDRLDALAIAVSHFTDLMSIETEKRVEQYREQARQRMIREFLKLARKRLPKADTMADWARPSLRRSHIRKF